MSSVVSIWFVAIELDVGLAKLESGRRLSWFGYEFLFEKLLGIYLFQLYELSHLLHIFPPASSARPSSSFSLSLSPPPLLLLSSSSTPQIYFPASSCLSPYFPLPSFFCILTCKPKCFQEKEDTGLSIIVYWHHFFVSNSSSHFFLVNGEFLDHQWNGSELTHPRHTL